MTSAVAHKCVQLSPFWQPSVTIKLFEVTINQPSSKPVEMQTTYKLGYNRRHNYQKIFNETPHTSV